VSTPIVTPAGTARPLLSGGYAVDCGNTVPTWVPDRDHAKAELRARIQAAAARWGGEEVGPVPAGPTSRL
jgi:hypothetical protein